MDMIEDNPGMEVNIVGGVLSIVLPNNLGEYTLTYLQTDPPGTVVAGVASPIPVPVIGMTSPVSGAYYKYEFCPGNRWWQSKDQHPHLLFELLTRELMKVCKGVPGF